MAVVTVAAEKVVVRAEVEKGVVAKVRSRVRRRASPSHAECDPDRGVRE